MFHKKPAQTVLKKKIKFIGLKWSMYNVISRGFVGGLPSSKGIYVVVIVRDGSNEKEIVYIGSSRNLPTRLYCHPIINLLRKNKKGFEIAVLFHVMECDNLSLRLFEKGLILEHWPVFNGHFSYKNRNAPAEYKFWNSLGIKKVNNRYGQYFPVFKK